MNQSDKTKQGTLVNSDDSFAASAASASLEYIANSPAREHGGFHPSAGAAAKLALMKIAQLESAHHALTARNKELEGALLEVSQKATLINNNVFILAGGAKNRPTLEWVKEMSLTVERIIELADSVIQPKEPV
jgi:hypothetical protein